jgi:hypothetical protein
MVYYKTKLYYVLAIKGILESADQKSKEQIIEDLKLIVGESEEK